MEMYERITNSEQDYYEYNGSPVDVYNKLLELENQIENGTLIELPCGVGDKVYVLDNDKISDELKISEAFVIDFDITSYNFSVLVRENGYDYHLFNCGFGCDWFLTKAEAEAKLKELRIDI